MSCKVLHVLDHSIPLHSGYTFRSKGILNAQRNLGLDTYHLTSTKHYIVSNSYKLSETIDGLKFYRTLPTCEALYKFPAINQLQVIRDTKKRLEKLVHKIKPDIIHAHSPALNGTAAAVISKRHKIPFVYEIRAFWEDAAVDNGSTEFNSFRYKLSRRLETNVIKKADYVTTICEGLKSDIVNRGINANKIRVVGNGVDDDLLLFPKKDNVSKLQEKFNLKSKYVLGFIGSFYSYEGLAQLIEVTKLLVGENKDILVMLIGGGEEESKLKGLVEQYNLSEYVKFTGRVPHEQVKDYFGVINAIVCPRISTRLTETVTPLKPLEAMAQRCIAIVSDVGGHKELINHGKTGYLYTANDVQSLYKCILHAMDNKIEVSNILNNAEKYVRSQRTWQSIGKKYLEIYTSLI